MSRPVLTPEDREGWSITDHVCRACFGGRILSRPHAHPTPGHETDFMCVTCHTRARRVRDQPVTIKSLCACGQRFNDVLRGPGKRKGANAGFRCISNPDQSDATPDIVVEESK